MATVGTGWRSSFETQHDSDTTGATHATRTRVVVPAQRARPGRRPLRVAMIGQKGLPATFGGIERHVEELGSRLAARGLDVTVFCRPGYVAERRAQYRGMTLRQVRSVDTKHLDAITHSFASTLAAMSSPPDIVHYHGLGPGLVAPLPRLLSRSKVVLTVHGLDHERQKWGRAAQSALSTAHWMSARVPDATIVVSRALSDHYATMFGRQTHVIPNGIVAPKPLEATRIRSEYGLAPKSYVVFVGRLVPEKAPDLLMKAWRSVPGDLRLVVAGDSSHTDGYVSGLRELAAHDPRIVFTGYVYGSLLAELYSNAKAFVLPSALEGLPLTLLEAASYGVPIVASDIPPHQEVLLSSAPGHRLFRSGDEAALAAELRASLAGDATELSGAARLQTRVLAQYRWEDAEQLTTAVYHQVLSAGAARPAVIDLR